MISNHVSNPKLGIGWQPCKQTLADLVYCRINRVAYVFNNIFQLFSVRTDPSSASLKMSQWFYYKGNCNDKDVQESLKSNYHQYLLSNGPVVACRLFGTECSPAKIEIYCGATDLSRRRRRGVDEMEVKI